MPIVFQDQNLVEQLQELPAMSVLSPLKDGSHHVRALQGGREGGTRT